MFLSKQCDIRGTGKTVTVPDNPQARLMYYLHCVATTLRLDNDPVLQRFTDFTNCQNLSAEQTAALLALALLFSPDLLIGKVFFPSEGLCLVDRQNKFYELEEATRLLAFDNSILVGGQSKEVVKIMMFRKRWMEIHYIEPVKFLVRSAKLDKDQECSCCVIL